MANIYISIASYRDPYLQSTLDSAFSTADNPGSLTAGCFIQLSDDDYKNNVARITNTYGGSVNFEEVSAGSVFSINTCRSKANQWLSDDHDYFLQIDSHTRFTPGWDTKLISWLSALPEKSLFSTYLPGWVPGKDSDTLFSDYSSGCQFAAFNDEIAKGYFMRTYDLVPNLIYVEKGNDDARKTWYLCGHFIFGPTEYLWSVQQPSWILFWGEELYNSLLAASYGWSVYAPPSRLLRHLYPQDIVDNPLPKIWVDFSEMWGGLHDVSTDKVIDVIVAQTTGEGYLKDVDKVNALYDYLGYNIGTILQEWRNERKALH